MVRFIFAAALLLGTLGSLVGASPVKDTSDIAQVDSRGLLSVWINMCTDDNCKSCGEDLDVTNPGCLSGSSKSVHFRDDAGDYNLVLSPASGCHCQSDCVHRYWEQGCTSIPSAGSYRWVSGSSCSSNNC